MSLFVPPARLFRSVLVGLSTVLLGSLAVAAPGLPANSTAPTLSVSAQVVRPDAESAQERIAPTVLDELATDGVADFMVSLEEQADLSAAASISDWDERGAYVVRQLQEHAARSQQEVTGLLDEAGVEYQAFWIANAVLIHDGDRELAEQVLALPSVERLDEPAVFEVPKVVPVPQVTAATAVEWGIEAIRADQVWSELDAHGEGLVIANIDTGVDFAHPALADNYRGRAPDGTVDHNYHWHDPSGVCPSEAPCDNQGHGTHTMGTMVGSDAGGTAIGVAPDATWIAAKGCEATANVGCSRPALLASGQWMLAPRDLSGGNPRPDLRPHIINNS